MTRAAKRLAGRPMEGGCDARGCTRFVRMVDRSTMRFAGRPLESVDLGRCREVAGVGRSEPCHVDGVKCGAMRSVDLWTVASAKDARYGLRGVRVGEANNPGTAPFVASTLRQFVGRRVALPTHGRLGRDSQGGVQK